MKKYLFLALFLLCPLVVGAKDLYVNNSGGPACSDSTTYAANSSSSPWCTIGRAAWGSATRSSPNSSQAAQPGDVVLINAGIYWTDGGNGRFDVALNPANSGTSGNPITFRGNGLVYVRMIAGPRGPMIGCTDSRNYIIWDNLQIDDYYGGSTSDTGPIHFGTSHCQLLNSDVKGHPGSYYHGYPTFGGNYRGVSLEQARNTLIKNNRIYNFLPGQNEAGVMAYDSDDNIIENNEFVNNGVAVFIKGVHPSGDQTKQLRNIIRKNLVRDGPFGIRVLSSVDAKIYQNIVINIVQGGLWAGFFNSTRSMFVNNTVYGGGSGITPQGADLVDVGFYNNIVMNPSGSIIFNWDGQDTPVYQDVNYNRNIYFGQPNVWVSEGRVALTLSQFQSYGKDVDSLYANPLFVNAANNDFRLQSDSPARVLGRTIMEIHGSSGQIIPAGAYITGNEVIGLTTGGDYQVLSAPINLRILN